MKPLRYFKKSEFSDFEAMETDLLELLDQVRYQVGVPFVVTSSFRNDEENDRVGGNRDSWHLTGEAVDFVPTVWNAKVLWDITYAVMTIGQTYPKFTIQLELVSGPTDKHIHLGLSPLGGEPSGLILALD